MNYTRLPRSTISLVKIRDKGRFPSIDAAMKTITILTKFLLILQIRLKHSTGKSLTPVNGLPPISIRSEEDSKSPIFGNKTARIIYPEHWTERDFISENFINCNARTYEQIVGTSVLIDKSLLIRRVFEVPTTHILITGPRGWGKSTNLGMIQVFAEMINDTNGEKIERGKSPTYQLFKNGRFFSRDANRFIELSELPLISYHDEIIENHLAKYSVINLELLVNISSEELISFNSFLTSFKFQIAKTFSHKIYLQYKLENLARKNFTGAADNLRKFNQFLNGQITSAELENELLHSVEILIECINTCYYTKILILIDEYDYVFNEIYFRSDIDHNDEEVKKILNFVKKFLLKIFQFYRNPNSRYAKIVITGIYKFARANNLFENLNSLEEWSMIDASATYPFYGFTAEEVDLLLEKRRLMGEKQSVYEFYDGYRSILHLEQPIFTPISIISYLDKKIIQGYWISTVGKLAESLPGLFKNLQIRLAFQPLLASTKNNILISPNAANPTLNELEILANLIRADDAKIFPNNVIDCAVGLLLSTGYLTLSQEQPPKETLKIAVTIPNVEIGNFFKNELKPYHYYQNPSYYSLIEDATTAFKNYFLRDQKSYFIELEKSLGNLFNGKELYKIATNHFAPLFKDFGVISLEEIGFLSANEAATHHIVFEILLRLQEEIGVNLGREGSFEFSPIFWKYRYRRDLLVRYGERIMIIEAKASKQITPEEILNQARDYLPMFAERKFEICKLVAINLVDENNVTTVQLKEEVLEYQRVKEFHANEVEMKKKQ